MAELGAQRRITAALIDLDDTLYRQDEMPKLVTQNIQDYMTVHMNFERTAAEKEAVKLYREHGTTLAGLVAKGHRINFNVWHTFVHDSLDYAELLPQRDARLRECLLALNLPRHVFTNADARHARKCLDCLGVRDCFQEIVCFETLNSAPESSAESSRVLCKPNHDAFQAALDAIGASSAAEVMFIDDSKRNIKAAHEMGLFTVWVGDEPQVDGADLCIRNVPELMQRMPRLFEKPVTRGSTGASELELCTAELEAHTVEPVAA